MEDQKKTDPFIGKGELFRSVADKAQVGFYITDAKGNYQYVNPYLLKLSGLSAEESLGQGWTKAIYSEDKETFLEQWNRAIADGGSWKGEFRFQRPDNTIIWVYGIVDPQHDASGNVIMFGGMNVDVTDRKKMEAALRDSDERLKLTLEATKIATWDWDVTHDTYTASPGYFTMLGYEPETGPIDRAVWIARAHPQDKNIITNEVNEVLNTIEPHYEYEARVLHADGTYRWIHTIGHVIERDREGKVARMIGVRMDVSERKKAEENYQQKIKELEKLNGLMVGRELEMVELKNKIEELEQKLKKQ